MASQFRTQCCLQKVKIIYKKQTAERRVVWCSVREQAHQMEQVKEENARLEAAISKERFGHARAEQECEKLQARVTQLEAREREVDAAIRDASAEVAQLTAVVAEAEKVRAEVTIRGYLNGVNNFLYMPFLPGGGKV